MYPLESINKFTKEQKVRNFIVIGRLQHDGFIGWQKYSSEKVIYKWVNTFLVVLCRNLLYNNVMKNENWFSDQS